VRHLDLTTHNHASDPANSLMTLYQDTLDSLPAGCETMKDEFETACSDATYTKVNRDSNAVQCDEKCEQAQKCILIEKGKDKKLCCGTSTSEDDRTGDHLIESNCFTQEGGRSGVDKFDVPGAAFISDSPRTKARLLGIQFEGYNEKKAPTVCTSEPNRDGKVNSHNAMQAARDQMKRACIYRNELFPVNFESYWAYSEAAAAGAHAHQIVNPQCNEECTRAQLDHYHQHDNEGPKLADKEPLRTYVDEAADPKGMEWLKQAGLDGKVKGAYKRALAGLLGVIG
jgi:hypothetical protein